MRNQTANETEERKAIATIEDVLKNTWFNMGRVDPSKETVGSL